jgi:hypothetical protein
MAFGNPLDPDDDQPVPPDFVRAVRLAIGIVTERELAAALNENHRTTQGKRVTGADVLPHVRRGRSILYVLPLVRDEIQRRAKRSGLEVVQRVRSRRRRAG